LAVAGVGGCKADDSHRAASPSTQHSSAPASLAARGDAPEARLWVDRAELPFDYYSDLIAATYLRMSDVASGDGGQWEIEQEKWIASCMKDKGFEYYPKAVEPPAEGASNDQAGDRKLWVPWMPDDLAEVERYGYGYSQGIGPSDTAAAPETDDQPDRNADYVSSLSHSAQEEYQIALMGRELADWFAQGADPGAPLPAQGGCMLGASEAHPYPWAQVAEESPITLYEDLIDRMRDEGGDPYAQITPGDRPAAGTFLRRQEVDALDTEWRECFERDFPEPEGSRIAGAPTSDADGPTGAWSMAFNTNQDGEWWTGLPDKIPLEYASLTGTPREIAIAVADFKCRQETDYIQRFLTLQREAQEEFVAKHKSELDQMVAALEDYLGG
jgi:hypothetical protein